MEMTPLRTGLLAAISTALAWFAVASILGAEPGQPLVSRTDVFFQSDAGGWIGDALGDSNERARGTHPALNFFWTRPLRALAGYCEPTIPKETTCTYGSRWLVNILGGLGIGVFAAGLRSAGIRFWALAAFAPPMWFGTGNTIAVLPDHFGISVGLLAAAFGAFYSRWPVRRKLAGLAALTVLAFGVTVTNALFPAFLFAWCVLERYRIRRRWYALAAFVGLFPVVAGISILHFRADIRTRLLERIELYLNWTLTNDPLLAGRRFLRGIQDSAVGPTPTVGINNAEERWPMVTYQDGPYSIWPYDALQSVGVAAWWFVLGFGAIRALRNNRDRNPARILLLWIGWNAVFHNVWGDEYFLYTPHYAWACFALALLGWNKVRSGWIASAVLPILAAALHTLWEFRRLLDSIPT